MGAEARGVGDRQPRPPYRSLERPAEVAMAGEPQPPTLGVPDPKLLHGWLLLRGCWSGMGPTVA